MATVPAGSIVQALFRPLRLIGSMTAMVTIEEDHHDEMMVTEHPVEMKANISDHAFMLPSEIRIIAGWSKSPNMTKAGLNSLLSIGDNAIAGVTNSSLYHSVVGEGGSLDYMQIVYQNLRTLQFERIPMNIITGKRSYKDMLIRSLSTTTRSDTENALIMSIVCRQVFIVKTQYTSRNDSANQKNPEITKDPEQQGEYKIIVDPGSIILG